jgi:hypothetical protein
MNLIKSISVYPNGTIIYIEWLNGSIIKGEIDTIYETDNGLDLDEIGYQEYFACAVKVIDILRETEDDTEKYKIGNLIEISELKSPFKITLANGSIIYEEK